MWSGVKIFLNRLIKWSGKGSWVINNRLNKVVKADDSINFKRLRR